MRALAAAGRRASPAWRALIETTQVRLLRPLLAMPPARLRATLRAAGVAWVEDPTNRDPHRLRAASAAAAPDRAGAVRRRGTGRRGVGSGRARAGSERGIAGGLAALRRCGRRASRCSRRGPLRAAALGALHPGDHRARRYPPPPRRVAATRGGPATGDHGRCRLLPAGGWARACWSCGSGGDGAAGACAARRASGTAGSVSAATRRLPGPDAGRAGRRLPPGCAGSRRCRRSCCGPCRRCGAARRLSPSRICSILTVSVRVLCPCCSVRRGRLPAAPFLLALGMHEGRGDPMLT